jgi:hypothetical protein
MEPTVGSAGPGIIEPASPAPRTARPHGPFQFIKAALKAISVLGPWALWAFNLISVTFFWITACIGFAHSIKGVLTSWLVGGLLFLLINLWLLYDQWRHLSPDLTEEQHRIEVTTLGQLFSACALNAVGNLIGLGIVFWKLPSLRAITSNDRLAYLVMVTASVVTLIIYGFKLRTFDPRRILRKAPMVRGWLALDQRGLTQVLMGVNDLITRTPGLPLPALAWMWIIGWPRWWLAVRANRKVKKNSGTQKALWIRATTMSESANLASTVILSGFVAGAALAWASGWWAL